MKPAQTTRERLRLARASQGAIAAIGKYRLEFWLLRGKAIILHDMGDDGVEVFVPATDKNDMQSMFKALGI